MQKNSIDESQVLISFLAKLERLDFLPVVVYIMKNNQVAVEFSSFDYSEEEVLQEVERIANSEDTNFEGVE